MLEKIYISAKCCVLAFYTDFCSSVVNKTKFCERIYFISTIYENIFLLQREERHTQIEYISFYFKIVHLIQ